MSATNQSASFLETASAATLFELFDASMSSEHPFNGSSAIQPQPEVEEFHKPRQILGESVFSQFAEAKSHNDDFPLGFIKLETPELTPSIETVTPLQLHSSIVESVFSTSFGDCTPMFEDAELDSSKWEPLFEASEMEIPEVPVSTMSVAVKSESVPAIPMHQTSASYTSPISSTMNSPTDEQIQNFTTKPGSKRSSSEAGFESSGDRSNSLSALKPSSQRATQPLAPIVVDSENPVAAKRARNTEAARRSRARKMERMNLLQDKVEELSNKNAELENEVLRLKAMLAAVSH